MRILFLAHRLPYPPNKGDKIRSFREIEALSRRHEVDLFCFYDQAEDKEHVDAMRQYCHSVYAEKLSWGRSRAQALAALAMGRPFSTAFFQSPSMDRRVRESLASRGHDLIFVFSSSMAPYAEHASIPRLLDMVDVDSDKWTQYGDRTPPPASWVWRAEGRRLAEHEKRWVLDFSLTLLCTPAEADVLRQAAPGGRIEAFENRMNTGEFDPARVEIPAEIAALQPYIIFTGSMDYFPNVDAATFFCRKVFPAVRAALPQVRFVIAGRNPVRAVRQLSSDPGVVVTGSVPDIRPYLRGAAVAVAPLRVARGVQNKILEAMAMGLPVAASSKVAKALPSSLCSEMQVEDDPRRLASFLIDRIQHGPVPPLEGPRRAVLEHFGACSWDEQLEGILARAADSGVQSSEEHAKISIGLPRAASARDSGFEGTEELERRYKRMRS
jgi:sugar transferase (PEP-CTERM/EpsH1 system associated)